MIGLTVWQLDNLLRKSVRVTEEATKRQPGRTWGGILLVLRAPLRNVGAPELPRGGANMALEYPVEVRSVAETGLDGDILNFRLEEISHGMGFLQFGNSMGGEQNCAQTHDNSHPPGFHWGEEPARPGG